MISRRALLGGSAAAVAGVAGLSGCATVTRSTDIAALNRPVELPTFQRFDGPKPDLPITHELMPDCFYRFPADPVQVTQGVPGDGSEITGTVADVQPDPADGRPQPVLAGAEQAPRIAAAVEHHRGQRLGQQVRDGGGR